MLNIPEDVRKKMDEMIEEATKGIPMIPQIKHMLVSICFEMYRAGYRDAHRVIEKSLELSKQMIIK